MVLAHGLPFIDPKGVAREGCVTDGACETLFVIFSFQLAVGRVNSGRFYDFGTTTTSGEVHVFPTHLTQYAFTAVHADPSTILDTYIAFDTYPYAGLLNSGAGGRSRSGRFSGRQI